MPALMDAGDIPRANAGLMRMMQVYFSVARSETIDNESMKLKHLRSAVWTGTAFKDILVLSPEFTWGLFGEHGELITQAIETASQEHLATGARGLTASGSSYVENVYAAFPVFAPLALVWIELDTANTCIDMQLGMVVSAPMPLPTITAAVLTRAGVLCSAPATLSWLRATARSH